MPDRFTRRPPVLATKGPVPTASKNRGSSSLFRLRVRSWGRRQGGNVRSRETCCYLLACKAKEPCPNMRLIVSHSSSRSGQACQQYWWTVKGKVLIERFDLRKDSWGKQLRKLHDEIEQKTRRLCHNKPAYWFYRFVKWTFRLWLIAPLCSTVYSITRTFLWITYTVSYLYEQSRSPVKGPWSPESSVCIIKPALNRHGFPEEKMSWLEGLAGLFPNLRSSTAHCKKVKIW